MKKFLLLFALVLTVCSTAMAQSVDECFTSGNLRYKITSLSPNTVEVTTVSDIATQHYSMTSVTIPGNVSDSHGKAYAVTAIAGGANFTTAAFYGSKIETITFAPNSQVTEIGDYAFYKSVITAITLPASLATIGKSAFAGCTALEEVTVTWTDDASIPTPGTNAFSGIDKGAVLHVPAGTVKLYKDKGWGQWFTIDAPLGTNEIYYTSSDGNVVTPFKQDAFGAVSIVSNVYDEDTGKGCITFDGELTSIGNNAFQVCSSLTSINLPDGVTSIGNYAFESCSSLTEIMLPDKLESFGWVSFRNCSSLAYVIFQGTTPPRMDNDSFYYPFLESGENVEGGTKLFVPNDDAVTAYETAGYTNVYAISFDQFKSKTLDEIATAMKGVTLTQDDAAIVTACKENITKATDIVTIFQERDNALSVINLQKAKDAAIAAINVALDSYADITEEVKETLEEYRSKISNATSVSQVNAAKKEALEIVLSRPRRMAKEDLTWCYIEVSEYVDLEPYFNKIDNATTRTDIDEIVKEAKSELDEELKEKIKRKPYFVIDDKWYLASISGYTYPYNGSISFQDGVSYLSGQQVFVAGEGNVIEYNRTLPEGVWQCWYEPFDVTVDTERFDAAEVAGILTNAQGETVVAFNKLENGATMKRNTIYVIRAKEGQGKLKVVANTIYLHPSKENQLTMQSAYDNFTLTSTYSPVEHGDWYTLDGTGKFSKMSSGSLKPQRFYLTITPRPDQHYDKEHNNAKAFINMTVLGDEEDVTGIENLAPTLSEGKGVIYDLMGRKVTSIQKGQIYIKDGKKYVAK